MCPARSRKRACMCPLARVLAQCPPANGRAGDRRPSRIRATVGGSVEPLTLQIAHSPLAPFLALEKTRARMHIFLLLQLPAPALFILPAAPIDRPRQPPSMHTAHAQIRAAVGGPSGMCLARPKFGRRGRPDAANVSARTLKSRVATTRLDRCPPFGPPKKIQGTPPRMLTPPHPHRNTHAQGTRGQLDRSRLVFSPPSASHEPRACDRWKEGNHIRRRRRRRRRLLAAR